MFNCQELYALHLQEVPPTTCFFVSNTLISSARLKLAKSQANAEQHPETELLLFKNYSHSSSTLYSKK